MRWGLIALAVVALVEVITLGLALRDLQGGAAMMVSAGNAVGTSPESWTADRLADVETQRQRARALLEPANQRIHADPFLGLLGHLPWWGDQVTAIDDLADAVYSSPAVVGDYAEAARQYTAARAAPGPPGPRMTSLLMSWASPLGDASKRLKEQVSNLRRDEASPLVPLLRDQVRQALDALAPAEAQASSSASAARLVPQAIGAATPQRYLLLFSNPAEIRGAGGFVGAVGTITFAKGTLQSLDIRPEEAFTALLKESFHAPQPLPRFFDYKKVPFEIGEAEWDPHFPTSARLSETMFKSATGSVVDGTISIDPYAIEALLAVTGPVDVPGYGSFNQDNFFAQIDFIVNVKQGPASGKEALPTIAKVIIARVLDQPASKWPKLFSTLRQEAAGRHIQAYLHSPELGRAVASARYDGAILPGSDDYLMVVDGNVGATKSDYYMTKSADIKVELPASGISQHQITLNYKLPPPVDETDRVLNQNDEGAYADYLRVYLPETAFRATMTYSQDDGKGFGSMDRAELSGGKRVVSGFFRLPRGHVGTVRIDYLLPTDGSSHRYDLYIQKQAGIPNRRTTLQVSFAGGKALRRTDLTSDSDMVVQW
jgi:hypothetical protein